MNKFVLIILGITVFMPLRLNAATYQMADLVELDKSKCLYSVSIFIDTEGVDSNAADLLIKYDPNEVTVIDVDKLTSGVQVVTGIAYESYVHNQAEDSKGIIKITGVRFDYLNGRELFAQIPFVAKVANPSIQINFEGIDNTYDSNVAELKTSYDLLNRVENIKLAPANYKCTLTPAQISSITIDKSRQVYVPTNVIPFILLSSVLTCISLLLVIVFLSFILKRRIKVVYKNGLPVSGVLINVYKSEKLVESYVSNNKGYFWINRVYINSSIEIIKEGFNTKKYENGIRETREIVF